MAGIVALWVLSAVVVAGVLVALHSGNASQSACRHQFDR